MTREDGAAGAQQYPSGNEHVASQATRHISDSIANNGFSSIPPEFLPDGKHCIPLLHGGIADYHSGGLPVCMGTSCSNYWPCVRDAVQAYSEVMVMLAGPREGGP